MKPVRWKTVVLAGIGALVATLGAGCGGSSVTVNNATTTTVTTRGPNGGTETNTGPGNNGGSNRNGPIASLPRRCSGGLAATQGVSCELASNLFYEYYKASRNGGNTAALSVWSPPTKQYYTASCSNGTVISCHISGTSDPYAEVRFTRAALDAYSPEQASRYAEKADLGPRG